MIVGRWYKRLDGKPMRGSKARGLFLGLTPEGRLKFRCSGGSTFVASMRGYVEAEVQEPVLKRPLGG